MPREEKSFLLLFYKKEALSSFLWLVVGAVLAWSLQRWAAYAIAVVRFPFGIDVSEGAVWQQLTRIPGPQMYGDIRAYPFLVFEYPPLYHLAVRAIAFLGADVLAAGRALSVAATLATGALIGVVTYLIQPQLPRGARLATSMLAGALPATLLPVIIWSCLMRVDMLGMALTYAGIALGLAAFGRPRLLYASILFFVLACYTKQTFIAAPVAMLAVHARKDFRQAARAGTLGLAVGLVLLAALTGYTQGGFVKHVLLYNVNRFDLAEAGRKTASWVLAYRFYFLLVAGSVVLAWQQRKAKGISPALVFLTLYLALVTIMLLASGKEGANLNYFIEWLCLWCVWIGWLAGRRAQSILPVLVPAILAVQLLPVPRNFDFLYTTHMSPAYAVQERALLRQVGSLDGPILSDDLVLLRRAGKDLGPEMPMLAELALNGRWDGDRLLHLVQSGWFGAVLTQYAPGTAEFEERYVPAMQAAIAQHYPRVVRYNEYRLCLPEKK